MIQNKVQKFNILKNFKINFNDNLAFFKVPQSQIVEVTNDLYHKNNLSLKLITATDEREDSGCFKLWYIFGSKEENIFVIPFVEIYDTLEFISISLSIHEASKYESRIENLFGLKLINGNNEKTIILHENWPKDLFPLRKDFNWQTRPKMASNNLHLFHKVKGEGVYEISVGPIHAGIIEPGHFRFSVMGESIIRLEPMLGFTHKGSEKLFEVLTLENKIKLSEKISGDSSFSHSLAFCQALEKLNNTNVPQRALYLRVIYAELERLANHFGDIGAIMADTGFNFGGSQGSRLREIIMQINEKLTGSRFLRGVNIIGGVTKDIKDSEKKYLNNKLVDISKDFQEVLDIVLNNTSLLNRLEGTGFLSLDISKQHGITGLAAKSLGISNDARLQYPYGAYQDLFVDKIIENNGDVLARFKVRTREVFSSINIIKESLEKLPEGEINIFDLIIDFKKNDFSVSIVEGWRGDIVYFIKTDKNGSITRVSPRDPSFVNWGLMRDAVLNNIIPDFPLINKSFNLSYSGNDL